MKKLMIILLCLCTLTACGGSNDYEELTTMLDEGKYSEAVDYINNLAYEAAKNNGTVDSQSDHINYLYGSWEYSGSNSDQTTYDIVFKDNGTCTIDGIEYLWTMNNELDTWMDIEILEGASKAYKFELSVSETNGFYTGYFYKYNSDNNSYDGLGYYRNPAHYKVIELTPDNWLDYFEVVSFTTFYKNAFGETTSCSYTRYYKLKDNYYSQLNTSNHSKIAYEYSYENGKLNVKYDLEEETLEILDFVINETYPNNSSTGIMSNHTISMDEQFYGFYVEDSYSPSTLSSGQQILTTYHNDPVMTRIQGNLMLWKGLD